MVRSWLLSQLVLVRPRRVVGDEIQVQEVVGGSVTLLHGLIVWRRGVDGIGGRARS